MKLFSEKKIRYSKVHREEPDLIRKSRVLLFYGKTFVEDISMGS